MGKDFHSNQSSSANIPPFVLAKIDQINRVCAETKVSKIGLFGSALREDFDPEKSDLDFLVEFYEADAPGISDRYFTLVDTLEEIFGRPVDLVTARSIKNPVFSASVAASICTLYAA